MYGQLVKLEPQERKKTNELEKQLAEEKNLKEERKQFNPFGTGGTSYVPPVSKRLNQPFSSIKYLVINAGCAHNQLINLLLYIPQLSHLSCDYLIKSNNNSKSEMMIKLNDLIHLTVIINDIDFNEFEEFLLKLCSQLQILNVKIHSSDKSHLNANRWEQLISQKMTSLNKFFFSYTDNIHGSFNITSHPLVNDFTSSFWINRKWIFKLLAHDDELTYSIRPYS